MHAVKTKANHYYPVTLGGNEYTLHYTYRSLAWMEDQFGVSIDEWGSGQIGQAKFIAVQLAAGLLHEGFETWEDVADLIPMSMEAAQELGQKSEAALQATLDAAKGSKKKPKAASTGSG